MDIKKIKLALTVDLMNLPDSQNPVNYAKVAMDNYSNEAGGYKSSVETKKSAINEEIEWSSFDIQFEHCTLSLDLIRNRNTKKEFLQSFNLQENLS